MKTKIRYNDSRHILLAFLAVAFLATGGIFVKLSALKPISTGFYRVLFSLPLLYPLARKHLKSLQLKDILILLLAGIFLAGDISLWNLSFSYTSVANANLLANLTPFTVIPLSYFLFKEKIPRLFIPGAALTLFGLFVLIGGKISPDPSNYLGDLLAFGASFFYAGFLLISYHLRDRLESSVIMFVSGFSSAATLFVISGLIEGFQYPSSIGELLPLIGLTLCLQVIGHNLLAHCQGNLNVNLSTVICLSQPALASIYSFLIFFEKITVKEMFGIMIIITGVYLVKLQYHSKKRPEGLVYHKA